MIITVDAIITAVCAVWKVNRSILFYTTRKSTSVEPRAVCMYMIRKYMNHSFSQIGIIMTRTGGKPFNHSTVLFLVKKVNNLSATNDHYKKRILAVIEILKTQALPVPSVNHLVSTAYNEKRKTPIIKVDPDVNKNMKSLRKILNMISSSRNLLDELLNDPDDIYLEHIKKVKEEITGLNSYLSKRLATIHHKLWNDRKQPD